jgi:hypothetical protein
MLAKEKAFELFSTYVEGWKENNISKIISPLLMSCKVIESHGPTYYGINDIKKWFELWMEANSKIITWDIHSFYYCEDTTAIFEWEFHCISHQQHYAFPGITVVKYEQDKIAFLHEFRMTHSAYDWDTKQLKSD